MTTGTRKTGEFCWINMLTPQPAQTRVFFGKLLGWTFVEIPGLGHRAQVGGRDIGGLFDLEGHHTPPGTLPHIGGLVKVENADAACAKVAALGGTAKPAIDLGDQGRIAACTDPNGAAFVVWQLNKFLGTDADSNQHGAPSWFETITTDVDRAAKFYAQLFGWTPQATVLPGFDYTTFKLGNQNVAGMMRITPQMGAVRPHWTTYFTVNDADESARVAVELGGKLCLTMKDVPGVCRFCGITSPQGISFRVVQYTSAPLVVVDVGNTRIKWGLCNTSAVVANAALPPDDLAAWQQQWDAWSLTGSPPWVLSGVHPARRDRLADWLRQRGAHVRLVTAASQLPLVVALEHPDKVGIDRLLNAVAVNTRRPPNTPAVIVDAGSAVTVDYLDKHGVFRGGAILPGWRLMAQALHDYTALLPLVEVAGEVTVPATSTVPAMRAGIFCALLGGIRELIVRLQKLAPEDTHLHVYLGGGDTELLAPYLPYRTHPWPLMTLEGVRLSAKDDHP
jgi:pantothenate kinase type III